MRGAGTDGVEGAAFGSGKGRRHIRLLPLHICGKERNPSGGDSVDQDKFHGTVVSEHNYGVGVYSGISSGDFGGNAELAEGKEARGLLSQSVKNEATAAWLPLPFSLRLNFEQFDILTQLFNRFVRINPFAGFLGFMSHESVNADLIGSGGIKPGAEGMAAFVRGMLHLQRFHELLPEFSVTCDI